MILMQRKINMKMNRRNTVKIISFLSAIVLVLGIWAGVSSFNLAVAERELTRSNERALTQLGTYLDDISLNLQKCMYSQSEDMLSDVSTKLWRSSASAKESLSEITDGNTEISGIYKFLSQVGEYTLSLNESLAGGGSATKEQTENLNSLLKYSKELSNEVNDLIAQEENGLLDFEMIKSTLQDDAKASVYLGDELNDANQALQDYPTLIYDGPFSDHVNNKKPALIENLEAVTQEQAHKKAAEFIGSKESQIQFLSKTEGNLSTFNFYNGDYTVSVTQKGGIVCYMLTSIFASEIKLSTEKAIEKATQFLNDKGYTKIKESYYSTNDGICTINFAYYENGITYYTDLIKVSVALDDGSITAFDATGYITNHTVRKTPENISYTEAKAQKLLKKELQVISSKKAFIPTEWETEIFVYEYHCKAPDGNEILVYIDPVTGQEKDILILLYSDGGVLTK